MKLCVGIASLLVATSSFAFKAPHIEMNKHMNSLAGQSKPLTKASCANFAGSWKGSCTITHDDGRQEVTPASVTIDQYACDYISFDDIFDLQIDGKKDEAETTSHWTSTTSFLPYFNGQGDLEVDFNAYGRTLGNGDQYISKGTGSMNMLINGKGELEESSQYAVTATNIISKEKHEYKFTSACKYTQVSN